MINNYISGWCTTASTGSILPSFHVACWLPHCLWYCDNVLMRIYKQYFDRKDMFDLSKKQQTGWRWTWLCLSCPSRRTSGAGLTKGFSERNMVKFYNYKLNTVWGMVTTGMFLITDDLKGGTNKNELWYHILHSRLFSGFGFFFSSRTFAFLPTFPVELVDSHSICHRESFSPAFPLREKCFLLLFFWREKWKCNPVKVDCQIYKVNLQRLLSKASTYHFSVKSLSTGPGAGRPLLCRGRPLRQEVNVFAQIHGVNTQIHEDNLERSIFVAENFE